MKTFFIIGGYTFLNPGDEAILKATVYRMQRLWPDCRFLIWADRKDFSLAFDRPVNYAIAPFKPLPFLGGGGPFTGFVRGVYRRLFPKSFGLLRDGLGHGRGLVRVMGGADFIVFIGGGYLNSYYNLIEMHYLYGLAKQSGKPVYLLGQTIGPFFRAQDRRIAESICAGAERIVVREEYSALEMKQFSEKMVEGTDDAVGFGANGKGREDVMLAPYVGRGAEGALLLGLNLHKIGRPGERLYQDLVARLNQFGDSLGGRKLKVVFLPMETSIYCDDSDEGRKLTTAPDKRFEYVTVDADLTVEQRVAVVAHMDLFVGMRFHSLVFAVSHAVPCVGLYHGDYYFRKVNGLLKAFGEERLSISLEHLELLPGLLSELYRDSAAHKARIRSSFENVMARQDRIYRDIFAS